MKRPIALLSTAVLALVGVTSLAGCSSSNDPASPEASTEAVQKVDGKLAEVKGLSPGDEVEPKIIDKATADAMAGKWVYKMHGEGETQVKQGMFAVVIDVTVDQRDPDNFKSEWTYKYPEMNAEYQMLTANGTTYERHDPADSWRVAKTQIDSAVSGTDSSTLSYYFKVAESIVYEGEEKVDGVPCSKYKLDAGDNGNLEMWLKENNEVYKAIIKSTSQTEAGTGAVTFTAYDFGKDVDIQAPNATDAQK